MSAFGPRRATSWGTVEPHHGIDLAAGEGAWVLSAADGKVSYVGERPHFGRVVVVSHAARWQTVYGNLAEVIVRTGEPVGAGTRLGRLGEYCDAGGGTCLHFELRHRGQAVDPENYLPR